MATENQQAYYDHMGSFRGETESDCEAVVQTSDSAKLFESVLAGATVVAAIINVAQAWRGRSK